MSLLTSASFHASLLQAHQPKLQRDVQLRALNVINQTGPDSFSHVAPAGKQAANVQDENSVCRCFPSVPASVVTFSPLKIIVFCPTEKEGRSSNIEFFPDCDSTEGTNHLWASCPYLLMSQQPSRPWCDNGGGGENQPSVIVSRPPNTHTRLITVGNQRDLYRKHPWCSRAPRQDNKHQTSFKIGCFQSLGVMQDVHLWTTETAIKINIWEPSRASRDIFT